MPGVFSCGFARAAIYHKDGISMNGKCVVENTYNQFCQLFNQQSFKVDEYSYKRKVKNIQETFRRWRSHDKEHFLQKFSPSNWQQKSDAEKAQHSFRDCPACATDPISNLFPSKSPTAKGKKSKISSASIKKNVESKFSSTFRGTKKEITAAARMIYKSINETFVNLFNSEFIDALLRLPELGITKKLSKNQAKTAKRKAARKYKEHCESQMAQNDVNALLGTRQSFNQRNLIRRLTFFEDTETATRRTEKRKMEESLNIRKAKRHCTHHSNLDFNKDQLIAEINTLPNNAKVIN